MTKSLTFEGEDLVKTGLGVLGGGIVFYIKHLIAFFKINNENRNEIEKLRLEMLRNIGEIKIEMQSFKNDHASIKSELKSFQEKESERWHGSMPGFLKKLDILLDECRKIQKEK